MRTKNRLSAPQRYGVHREHGAPRDQRPKIRGQRSTSVFWLLASGFWLLTFGLWTVWGFASGSQVDVCKVEGVIGPVVSEFIVEAIHQAVADSAVCLIIELDTPGLTSPRLAGFGFKKLRRPIFPLDVEMLGITELKSMDEE